MVKPTIRVRAGEVAFPNGLPAARADAFTVGGTRPRGAYEIVGGGRRSREWSPSSYGPNSALLFGSDQLRRRSRDQVRNNGYAEAAVNSIVTNVIGTGIKPEFVTGDAGLNAELAALWLDWTDESDADGRLDFYGQQNLIARQMVEAGEGFCRFRLRRPEDGLSVPLQLQLVESEFCPVDKNELAPNGDEIRQGVQFTAVGQRRAYWFYRQHPDDLGLFRSLDTLPVQVPAQFVAQLAAVRRPGQIRGEPWLTRALAKLFDVRAYDDAEIMAKRVQALFGGFITAPSLQDSPFDNSYEEEAPTGEEELGVIDHMEPGTLYKLRSGEEITFPARSSGANDYDVFMVSQLRNVAASVGILYEQLTGDMRGMNDRTARVALNDFRRRCRTWQHNLVVFQFCRPTMAHWIDAVVMNNIIRLPRGMERLGANQVRWVPEGWEYIHPLQDVQTKVKEIEAGLRSRSDVISERGDNIDQVRREIEAERAADEAVGLDFTVKKPEPAGGTGEEGQSADQGRGAEEQ